MHGELSPSDGDPLIHDRSEGAICIHICWLIDSKQRRGGRKVRQEDRLLLLILFIVIEHHGSDSKCQNCSCSVICHWSLSEKIIEMEMLLQLNPS